jgi:nondiscriminating aspartyl-tRNA synthetase
MQVIGSSEAERYPGRQVTVRGHVHSLRLLGNIAFLRIRDSHGTIQATVENKDLLEQVSALQLESAVIARGELVEQPKSPGQFELRLEELTILSLAQAPLPVEINKENRVEALSISTLLDYRPITLRSLKARAVFKIEAALCAAFRQYLNTQGFTEIHSPKLVATGTEGGAQLFAVEYFGRQAYLAQSPQFYKQMMVGVFERVFEIAAVYRAEEHDTTRHLNEYISMDFEMGFIESEQDIIRMQVGLLKYMLEHLRENCQAELELFGAKVPEITDIPQIKLQEAHELLRSKLKWKNETRTSDLDPEAEQLLCNHFRETEGSEFVYITHYPREVRPFYAMPEAVTGATHSFDLLFRGLEITTGGQRIHQYEQLCDSIRGRGLQPESFSDYLQCFRYGMPPHGGLAFGLERVAKQLLNLPNVKQASLFPRDCNRLTP